MKIAVLMSTYNGERFLREQLDSILDQTFHPLELYIRDDGSTDGTRDIIEEYALAHSNVFILEDMQAHRGCCGSFRYLAKMVDADYYFFSDQDDVWMSDKVSVTLERLLAVEDGRAAIVHTDLEVVDSNLRMIHPSFFRMTNREPEKASDVGYNCAYPTITGCAMAFNRKAAELFVQAPDVQCLHDRLIGLSVCFHGGVIDHLDRATIRYRQHASNVLGATAERSLLKKLARIRDSWQDNRSWYRDVKEITGISLPAYMGYKLKYGLSRAIKGGKI